MPSYDQLLSPDPIPDELRERAARSGWPEGLLERAAATHVRRVHFDWWFNPDVGDPPPLQEIEHFISSRERLQSGTLHARLATIDDDDSIARLFDASPEPVGRWEVTVEREPYPFAQFRLAENCQIQVLEDRGVLLGAVASSVRNTMIGGQRTTALWRGGFRIHEQCRGQGLSYLVQGPPPADAWFGQANYYYVRPQNMAALGWIRAINPGAEYLESDEPTPGIPVNVAGYPARAIERGSAAIRPVRRSDIRRCVALINRTHRGQDLFRPYTDDFLRSRLDDPHWGKKPPWWTPVYGWEDYSVVEEGGKIVACGGLWDRGQHMRERWRDRESGDQRVVSSTALLDFGYAPGREDAMTSLIERFVAETDGRGRDRLLAPLDRLPELSQRLERLEPVPDTRTLIDAGETGIASPYTDLAYW